MQKRSAIVSRLLDTLDEIFLRPVSDTCRRIWRPFIRDLQDQAGSHSILRRLRDGQRPESGHKFYAEVGAD
ncbi:MAG: hypothetical protein LQ341_001594 [Variospora aurantia]|nr:MAG: hypothetical protein LQ341_001594 [Variospora aurantia]